MKRLIPLVILFVTAAGCGSGVSTDYSNVDLVSVSGLVTLDDQPVVGAVVQFEAEDGSASIGKTDGSGEFELQFNSEKSGVTPGMKTVRITTSAPMSDEEIGGEGEDDEEWESEGAEQARSDLERVPVCYNVESRLKVTVTSDSGRMEFRLKSDCSTTGPAE